MSFQNSLFYTKTTKFELYFSLSIIALLIILSFACQFYSYRKRLKSQKYKYRSSKIIKNKRKSDKKFFDEIQNHRVPARRFSIHNLPMEFVRKASLNSLVGSGSIFEVRKSCQIIPECNLEMISETRKSRLSSVTHSFVNK